MTDPSRRSVPLTVALAASLAAVGVARGDAITIEPFLGTWQYADGDEGRERVDEAIGDAVDGLPFFAEPIAEDRIEARTGPYADLRFEMEGDTLVFSAGDYGPVRSVLGGPSAQVRGPAGSDVELTQRLENGRLVQIFENDEGRRRTTYAPSGDGQSLWMRTRISSPRLGEDVEYRLRYRTAGGDARRASR